MRSNRYKLTKQTLKFCIAGFFIPGLTVIVVFGIQVGLGLLSVECTASWAITWTITTVGMIVAPIYFVRKLKKTLNEGYEISINSLINFNLIEYVFIQSTLAALFSNPRTLCYLSDGQNGLEFVFTGWMAMPLLVMLSLVFDNVRHRRIEAIKSSL